MSFCFSVGRRRSRVQWRNRSGIAGNSPNRALCCMLRSKHPGRRRVLPSPCTQITFKQVRELDPLTFSRPVIEKIRACLWQGQIRPVASCVSFVRGRCRVRGSYSLRLGWRKASVNPCCFECYCEFMSHRRPPIIRVVTWDKGSEIIMLWQNAKFWKIVWGFPF